MKKMMLFCLMSLCSSAYAAEPEALDWDTVKVKGGPCFRKGVINKSLLSEKYGFSEAESKQILEGTYRGFAYFLLQKNHIFH